MVDRLVREHGLGQVHYRYRAAIQGFAATIPAQALEGLRRNPNVEFIEADGLATISAGSQSNPPSWGLDRVDQQNLPLNNSYSYQNEGQNVEAYVLDTGIRYTHQEFAGGRAVSGRDFVDNDDLSQDCHGHGTHVAGTVGGSTTGIAKQVKLIGVRVLNCSGSGSYSGITAAVDWVTQQKQQRPTVPMVGNMSLGGGVSTTLNTAVDNSVDANVVWAVAAGNENTDACTKSPASAAKALTTGASTSSDARSSFSNYGTCVDLFAPGSSIYSSTYNGDNTYASWNGTSMASPHVAGVAALYLSANPTASAATANSAITGGATTGKISSAGTGSPNRLLYSLIAGGTVEPPPPPAATAVHLSDLDGSKALSGKKFWKATVTVEVKNASGALVAGALVAGSFSSGSGSCTTGSNGRCSITSGNINQNTASTTFMVTGATGTGLSYDASANTDPDGDSNGTSITVTKP
jgi:subtilisin family serine protease